MDIPAGFRSDRFGTGVGEINARIEQTLTAATEIAGVAERSAASAEEVSASTEQTSASAQEIAASAQELARSAEQLTSRFHRLIRARPAAVAHGGGAG